VITAVDIDLSNLAVKVARSMVRLEVGGQGLGTGTIWHPLGLMVTNAHVASVGPLNALMNDGRLLKATLIGIGRETDVAVLQLDVENEVEAIPIGDAHKLRPGELIFAMGFPWGRGSGFTLGSFIGLSPLPEGVSGAKEDWLSGSLHLRPGHSGGPMFNTSGELVGLNTVMQGPDVGVAIPAYRAAEAVKRFLPRREKAHIHA
jgi:serine protease Do